ncbi:hypothetical protein An08g06640 [Aspergillus niger]|uniref:Uncharacterized protein n=2 Tax=Aspergillus niger TaxID=5061 RepID=A2QRN3_ASPNC|nr:hypothetical protein An08g06640 [Aspergillus niger]CAK45634.1 hypothetical protein An08g06640 [Aspergillus niger]
MAIPSILSLNSYGRAPKKWDLGSINELGERITERPFLLEEMATSGRLIEIDGIPSRQLGRYAPQDGWYKPFYFIGVPVPGE